MPFDEEKRGRQKILLIVAVVVLVAALAMILRQFTRKSPTRLAAERVFKCVEEGCGHEFEYIIKLGDKEPLTCPKCGKLSAYKAESCYWAKDAEGNWKAKLDPTFVVVKKQVDPTTTEKTYCPDCGHQVVGHNPRPPKELMEAARREAAGK